MAEADHDTPCSDADREAIGVLLRQHVVEEHLDLDEFSARLERLYTARTLSELTALTADLPALPVPDPASGPLVPASRRELRQHAKRLAAWEKARAAKQAQLALATSGGSEGPLEFPCPPGERVLATVPKTALRVWTTTAAHTERQTRSVSNRGAFGARRHTGTTRTYTVPGREVQVTADTGTLYITNKRLGFRGPKRTLDLPIQRGSAGIKLEASAHQFVISVSSGQPITYRYPRNAHSSVAFALELAHSRVQGTTGSLISRLESELRELDDKRPELKLRSADPSHQLTRASRSTPKRTPRGHAPAGRGSLSTGLTASRHSRLQHGSRLILLLTLPFGMTTWVAFLYAGRRTGRASLMKAAGVYGVALVAWITLAAISNNHGGIASDVGAVIWLFSWLGGIAHALVRLPSINRDLAAGRKAVAAA